jgi:AmmeMemoRadiSam system protein B
MSIRNPAVAGIFYPDDARELQRQVQVYLREAVTTPHRPKAIIVPHAGYVYSGSVAATAYASLLPHRDRVERVVLLGPSHRVPLDGMAVSSADFFATPLGNIPVDQEAVRQLLALPRVRVMDAAHLLEHSLEVQLPFLQEILAHFRLVPIVVGESRPDEVAEVLDRLWGGVETLLVISSDLSHYQDYETARRLDRATSDAIEALAPQHIHYDDACGRNPVNGLLLAARQRGLRASTLDLRNSGDTAGPRDRVVGYGAYVFE